MRLLGKSQSRMKRRNNCFCVMLTVCLEDNTRHYREFMEYKSNGLYKAFVIGIDLFIVIAPILILNIEFFAINNNWYFLIICMAILSTIDPFLCLQFTIHKLSQIERKMNGVKMIISFFLCLFCMILIVQKSKPGMSLEQSNDFLFILFSLFCYSKIITIVQVFLAYSKFLKRIFMLMKQIFPFLI